MDVEVVAPFWRGDSEETGRGSSGVFAREMINDASCVVCISPEGVDYRGRWDASTVARFAAVLDG